jgi:hypothetical protein
MGRLDKLFGIEELRYHSATEFDNPFFVLVHTRGEHPPNLNREILDKVSREIAEIREKYDFVEMDEWPPQTIPQGVPKDRPILVCGFFGGQCVMDQRNSLKRNGYDAYISREGTF